MGMLGIDRGINGNEMHVEDGCLSSYLPAANQSNANAFGSKLRALASAFAPSFALAAA